MMGRRQRRIMDDLARVFAKPPGRLHADINVAVPDTGDQQAVLIVKDVSRCIAPLPGHLLPHRRILRIKPLPVFVRRHSARGFFNLAFRQETAVIGKAGRNFIDQLFTVFRQKVQPIPCLLHGAQQQRHTGRRIQSLGAADAVVGRRIIMEDDCHPLLIILQMRKHGPLFYLAGKHLNPLMQRRVPGNSFIINFFIGHRADMDDAVNLRLDHIAGQFHWNHARI